MSIRGADRDGLLTTASSVRRALLAFSSFSFDASARIVSPRRKKTTLRDEAGYRHSPDAALVVGSSSSQSNNPSSVGPSLSASACCTCASVASPQRFDYLEPAPGARRDRRLADCFSARSKSSWPAPRSTSRQRFAMALAHLERVGIGTLRDLVPTGRAPAALRLVHLNHTAPNSLWQRPHYV